MTKRSEDKVAVITGGNSGIGLETAKEFARHGARVALLVRSQEKLDNAIAEIGHGAIGFIGDVTDLISLQSFFLNVTQNLGKIDIVLSSAGIYAPTPLDYTEDVLFTQISDINFKGTFFTVKYAAPHLNQGASR